MNSIIWDLSKETSDFLTYRDGFEFIFLTWPKTIKDAIAINSATRSNIYRPLSEYIEVINKHNIQKVIIDYDDLWILDLCENIRFVEVYTKNLETKKDNWGYLYDKKIKHLVVKSENIDITSKLDFEKLTDLESTYVDYKLKLAKNIENCEKLKSLDALNVKKEVFREYRSLNIDSFYTWFGSYKNVEDICNFNNLVCLGLDYNRYLTDISQLSNLNNLKRLVIENCPNIYDYTSLKGLKKLEYIRLFGNYSIASVDFIRELPNLKTFICEPRIEDGDLTPCQNLQHVRISKQRRNYNLDINSLPRVNTSQMIRGDESIDEWRRWQ